ncbi:hypothetical protein [Pseudomonas sp. EA_65y_Pfl2_P74]|uniref:hypothetical protein n=1 Tax=Pseudomonas sp. EA_65y_Pfl2_P74 TaxID=3088694 RepID=UPI0030D82D91
MEKKSKSDETQVRVDLESKTNMNVSENLAEIEKRVKELKESIQAGQPLSMGKTNMLSGLLRTLRNSMGAW